MSFIWPLMLLSLLALPALVALYVGVLRRRRRLAASYGSLGLVREAAAKRFARRRQIPPAIFLIGLAPAAHGVWRDILQPSVGLQHFAGEHAADAFRFPVSVLPCGGSYVDVVEIPGGADREHGQHIRAVQPAEKF